VLPGRIIKVTQAEFTFAIIGAGGHPQPITTERRR
jgi:hypothetical protein